MVVRCEEACATDVGCNVVEDGLCDRYTVVGGGAATELVKDYEGAGCGFRKDLLGFGELDEESTLCREDIVVGAQAGHYAVARCQRSRDTWNVAANLCHDDCDASLESVSL